MALGLKCGPGKKQNQNTVKKGLYKKEVKAEALENIQLSMCSQGQSLRLEVSQMKSASFVHPFSN